MTTAPVIHSSFTLERTYPASPARVFAAWADPEIKARWFIGPEGWKLLERELDLRPGGREVLRGVLPDGRETSFAARYHDVVPDQRLLFVYDMHHGGTQLSVSMVTVEIRPAGTGAHLVLTEQVAFLNGDDGTASRKQGTAAHLDRMGKQLQLQEQGR
jgi:uncharacterized protein YndB with AHSA1/START domain